jgi:peptidoglycan/xylan/chitin deacetylase (PgdA/CDA1 family)
VSAPPPRAPTVVNLCFHGIGTPERELEPDEERYWVEVEQFEELLEVVRRHPSLRLTFDDGNASDAEIALPALERAGLTGSFFVVAGRMGQRGSLRDDQVRELAEAGMTIGNHGLRHRSWRSLGAEALDEELDQARASIADAAGRPVDEASCPFGEYDRRVLRSLRQRGFRRVYTVDEGPARADAWLQARHTIRATDTPVTVERLAGSRSSVVQSLRSAVKRWR